MPSILSPSNLKVKVRAGDNWLIPGRKGCGKTTFSKQLVTHLADIYPTSRVYILDIKFRDFNDGFGDPKNIVQSEHAPNRPGRNQRVQIWQPLVEDANEIEKFLWNVLHDPPAILDIDEALALYYGGKDTSDNYSRITKLGRALPITTIASTQELVKIPRNMIGQHDHLVAFRVKHPYEKVLLKQLMGEHDEPQDRHGFYYMSADEDRFTYFRDFTTFF
jgi:energy-coupling factor transporter ATP-binding protein EcfA2